MCIFSRGSACFCCPLIDPHLQQRAVRCYIIAAVFRAALFSLFDVQYGIVLDCYYQIFETRSLPPIILSIGGRQRGCLPFPVITVIIVVKAHEGT